MLTNSDKFLCIPSSQNRKIILAVAEYITKAMEKLLEIVYTNLATTKII